MGVRKFMDLRVWQAARSVILDVYRVTRPFPADERFVLVAQMRRAAISIGANIAEGFGWCSPRDRARFYEIAKASAEELRHHLIVSADLRYMKTDPILDDRLDAVCAMLYKARMAILSGSATP